MRKFGIIALENEDNLPADGEAVVEDAANSAETALLEVNDEVAEGDTSEAAVDEAVEAVSSLEAYAAALEAANAEGGLSRAGASVMNIGLESIYRRLGFQAGETNTVSLENFGQNSSRAGATTIALEGVKEKIKEIWAAIIAHIKKAIEWVKGHFNKIFGTAEKLQKRAKALSEAAKGINGQPKEKTFENERLAKALSINGNVPASISTELTKVTKVADIVFTSVADFNGKGAEKLLEEMGKTDGKVDQITALPIGSLNGMAEVANPQGAGFSNPPSGLTLYRGAHMLGNKTIIVEAPKAAVSGAPAVEAASKTSVALGAFDPKAKETSKTTVNVVDPGEVGKIADEVANICQEVIKYKAKLGKASDLKSKIVAAAERAGKDANSEEDKDKAAYHSAMQKIATSAVNNLDRAPAAMSAYALNTAKAALDLAEQSLKQYGTK
jgi:hypothetical protein